MIKNITNDILQLKYNEFINLQKTGQLDFSKNKNINKNNVTKYSYDTNMKWFVLFQKDQVQSYAACSQRENNSLMIYALGSFKKGYGKSLLDYIIKLNYSILFLIADPTLQNGKLIKYYNQCGFTNVENTYWFYKNKRLNNSQLDDFIKKNMSTFKRESKISKQLFQIAKILIKHQVCPIR